MRHGDCRRFPGPAVRADCPDGARAVMLTRLALFLRGWRRRSAMLLDAAGCPPWLWKWRCPVIREWGTMLQEADDAGQR